MTHFVDGESFWLAQVALLIECILLKEKADIVGAV